MRQQDATEPEATARHASDDARTPPEEDAIRSVAAVAARGGARAGERNAAAVAVSIERVSKVYPVPLARLRRFFRRKAIAPVEALRDVSLEIREGEVFGLIGRNGAGKTTLTKIIATLVQPTAGTVSVRGFDSVREEEQVRACIGLASAEERSFYWRLTAEQNLMFFARLYGLADREARRRIAELLARVELEEVARRRFGELSTGNKQRMAIARAMLNNPPVLLLDEPTRSLDPVAAARTRELISSLATGERPATILLTSHNLAEIEELCERIAIISRGRIRAIDTTANLRALHRQQERVTISFGGIARARISPLLRARVATDIDVTGATTGDDETTTITFMREPSDERLDAVLRVLVEAGARIVACETGRASLLDVLESYERDTDVGETDATRAAASKKEKEEGIR